MNEFVINDLYGCNFNYDYLEEVINKTLEIEKVKNALVSIIFVNEEEIRKINFQYRGLDKVTDVISFAFEDNEEVAFLEARMLGDIYVCISKMQEQAKLYNHSEKRELSFLVVHGLLHLLGYDHTKSIIEEQKMFAKQEQILNELNIVK